MTVESIKNIILNDKSYDFLKTNEHLGKRIGMLCLGGSLAYGTNLEGKGDIDLRGFAFEKKEEILGLTPSFGQVVETNTDTTIYASFRGIVTDPRNNTYPSATSFHSLSCW